MNRKFNRSERGSLWYKSRCCVGIWQREMFTKSKNLSQFARCAGWYYKRVIRNTKSDPAYRVQTTQLTAKQNSNNTNSKYLQVFRQYMKILRLRQMFLYWHKTYRVIHMSLRDFRPLQYRSRDGHAEWEHVNRRRDNPNFRPTLQVLDMITLGDAADVNSVIKFLPHTMPKEASKDANVAWMNRHMDVLFVDVCQSIKLTRNIFSFLERLNFLLSFAVSHAVFMTIAAWGIVHSQEMYKSFS